MFKNSANYLFYKLFLFYLYTVSEAKQTETFNIDW